jgi:hypothetical protein
MARKNSWMNILSDFVRKNPRTSAMIAFNLGVYAAQATKKTLDRTDLKELPSKLVDLVPSMKDMSAYVPAALLPAAAESTPSRRRARVKTTTKVTTKRTTRRRATKRRAA